MEFIEFPDASNYHQEFDPSFYDIVSCTRNVFPNGGRNEISCERCNRIFYSPIAKLQHLKHSSKHNICCSYDFSSSFELQQHFITDHRHSYCEKCNVHFKEEGRGQLYWHHVMNNPLAHHFCRGCQVELETPDLLDEHLEAVHFCCVRCEMHCGTEENLELHRQTSERHWICHQCLRDFPVEAQLLQHQKAHLPRDVTCPGCDTGFCSNSALIIHWENTTTCLPSRHLLNQYILQFDTNSTLIPSSSRHYVQSHNAHRLRNADETRDWNGDVGKWECILCGGLFDKFVGLDQHLQSPFHDVCVYRCNGCKAVGEQRWFSSLSGLVQHVEDTGCGNGGKGEFARKLMEFLRDAVAWGCRFGFVDEEMYGA